MTDSKIEYLFDPKRFNDELRARVDGKLVDERVDQEKFRDDYLNSPEHFFDWNICNAWVTERVITHYRDIVEWIDKMREDPDLTEPEIADKLVRMYVHYVRQRLNVSRDSSTALNREIATEAGLRMYKEILKTLRGCHDSLKYFPERLDDYRREVDYHLLSNH